MTLQEALFRFRQQAEAGGSGAEEARQVFEWLRELQRLKTGEVIHWPAAELIADKMKVWARDVVMRFGRPVYLVGSALEEPNPRDVDVRVVLSDAEFDARWGNPSGWHVHGQGWRQYAFDMGKLCKQGSRRLMLNLDLQVQRFSSAKEYTDKRRLRLDDVEGLEDATEKEEEA